MSVVDLLAAQFWAVALSVSRTRWQVHLTGRRRGSWPRGSRTRRDKQLPLFYLSALEHLA